MTHYFVKSILCIQSLICNFSVAAQLQPRSLAHRFVSIRKCFPAGLKLKDQFKQRLLHSVKQSYVTATSQCAEFRGTTVTNVNVYPQACSLVT